MIKFYVIVATFIFLVETFSYLYKLTVSIYPRRPPVATKIEDMAYCVLYLVFTIYGLLVIF